MAKMEKNQNARPTLLDIAADAGVSRATVSLVIRNVPRVTNATRKRVLRSIERLGYVYNRGAASLRMQQSNAIGLIVSDITNPFFAEAILAIEERLATAGFVTLLGNTSEDRAKEDRLLKTMREFPADGLLICPALDEHSPQRPPPLNVGRVLPVVAFVRRAPGLDYAGIDNAQGAQSAVDHLCRIGHRRIAFLGGNPQRSTGEERLQGYRLALARWELPFDPLLVLPSVPNRRGGFTGVNKLLELNDRPTAALCFNDVVALGAMEALHQLGLKPGADFGVVGFNNIPEAAQSVPELTTVDTVPRQLGEAAAELLLKRIERPAAPKQTVILEPRLVIRGSCGVDPGRTS